MNDTPPRRDRKPIPDNWEDLPRVTVIHSQWVGLALLERKTPNFYVLRLLNPNETPQPFVYAGALTGMGRVTLLSGHRPDVIEQFQLYEIQERAYQRASKFIREDIEREEEKARRSRAWDRMREWEQANPPPIRPRVNESWVLNPAKKSGT